MRSTTILQISFIAATALIAVSVAEAQNAPDWRQPPTSGTVQLESGFTPDPWPHQLTAGGGSNPMNVAELGLVDAQTGARCTQSYIARSPDFRFNFTGGDTFEFLRFYVVTHNNADATLLINQPDGSWRCNDDAHGTLMPAIDFSSPQSGQYDIWVGTYDVSANNPATLYITELEHNNPSNTTPVERTVATAQTTAGGGVPDWRREPSFGAQTLESGFTPDPWQRNLTAGGGNDPVDVSTLGLVDAVTGEACSQSYVARSPDFRFNFSAGSTFNFLRFYVETQNGADATLLINQPDGSWRCNDDSHGTLMPTIDFSSPSSGQYDVWVGTYQASSNNPATLFITELQSNHP